MKKWIRTRLLKFNAFRYLFIRRQLARKPPLKFAENDLIFLFFKYFGEHRILVDVGAHFGESFRPFENLGWNVFAFEPDPSNRNSIKINSARTKLFQYAISDRDEDEVVFYTSPESTGISSLAAFHASHRPSVHVRTKTLTTFCAEESITKIDFLKIDTEGYDLFVLKGFPFDKIKPRVIMCEFEDAKTVALGYTALDMGNYLKAVGYMVYISEWEPILKYGGNHKWLSIKTFDGSGLQNSNGWGNFLAVHPDEITNFDSVKSIYLEYTLQHVNEGR